MEFTTTVKADAKSNYVKTVGVQIGDLEVSMDFYKNSESKVYVDFMAKKGTSKILCNDMDINLFAYAARHMNEVAQILACDDIELGEV